ncbi:hypothetical protein ACS0TY_006939 [Phlomoides rotata]
MTIFLLLLALPLLLILYFQTQKSRSRKNVHPPGPPGLPLIGNLHQFDGKFPHTYLHRLSKQYGSIFSLKLGYRKVIVISSADVVKQIMKSYDIEFSSRPVLTGLQKLSYNGLDIAFSPYNETWREMRKIGTLYLFSTKQLQSSRPVCKDELSKMINKISEKASLSKVANLSEMVHCFTNNTICRVAFGKVYGGEEYGKNRFFDLLHDAQYVMGGFYVEDFFPLFGWIDCVTGMKAKLEKTVAELDGFYEELIKEHLDPNRPKSMEGDVLDILLEIRRNGTSSIDFTIDHIKAILMMVPIEHAPMNIITGGTDTSLAVILWALTALMKNPLIMKKVQREIRDVCGKKEFIDEEDIAKLAYLRAVAKETLRLYPPAPLLPPRETIKKCCLNGYDIEEGTMVYLNAWAIARDEKTWKNPNEFSPERFIESDIDIRGLDPEVIPFGIGRRGCPGMAMGTSTVEIALANVLYKFDWELPDGVKDVDFDALPGMTMHKKNDLLLVPKLVIA